jgi:hypothetical protein
VHLQKQTNGQISLAPSVWVNRSGKMGRSSDQGPDFEGLVSKPPQHAGENKVLGMLQLHLKISKIILSRNQKPIERPLR